ncbi:MAG: universal stress protein [Bacteroidetes bacterium]|nr:universal stress protein [Bacteroidota bacterium]
MFKKILIASDLSPVSDSVITCMKGFKSLGVEEVILFYALGIRHLDSLKYLIKDFVEPALIKQQNTIKAEGFNTTLEIAPGIPSEEIKRVAQEKNVSLIVVGSHGESAASHLLFRIGKVTSEVLHSHEKPLLLIRTKVTEVNDEKCVAPSCVDFKEKILYATDFSDTAHRAFDYAERIVEDGCKNVTLIHVQDKTKIDTHLKEKLEEFNRIDIERLEMLKERLVKKGATNVEIKIPYGNPTQEILNESKNGYTLIVMGSQGRGFIKELFLGSVSHNIARSADMSVLLMPALR